LIIIGRSVASGHYQDPPETLFWNTAITKPIINMGAYTMRNSRLGQYTGGTIPDTGTVANGPGQPVRLTVTNPSHPIFNGIALDGSNTMVNFYSNAVTIPFAPNTVQRGISVVTNPVVPGGQVLATVGTAGDLAFGGTVIALIPPGTTTATDNAVTRPATVLGGHRLIFLSGSREHAANATAVPPVTALTAEGSGIYDLSADGNRMFLNAVNFMLTVPEPASVSLLLMAVAAFGLIRRR
jgi:hypothetical protein